MKVLLVTLLALFATAQAGSSQYGVPQEGGYESGGQGGQVFRHVYIHTAPDDQVDSQSRTIRVPGGDKHVNIIFVKAPSSSSQQNTEVILPEQDQQKTLVYVLLKKGEATSDVKIRRPAAPAPSKPDVYFIRYKDQQQAAPQYGAPVQTPSSAYGVN